MTMNELKGKLKEFKLAGMANSLEERISYGNDNSISYQQFLELLCEDEENNRRDNSYKKRYRVAKLSAHKVIEEFDFNFQPQIDKKVINDLLTCNYIESKKNVVFIGNPGTGKTHLATSLAIRALAKNYKVLFTSVSEMIYQLHISKADNSYYKKLRDYLSVDLLVLDELGFKRLPEYSTNDFFEIISRKYERSSCIITTNKDFTKWEEIFGDGVLSGAILDRIVHYSTVIKINGPSYRAKGLKNSQQGEQNNRQNMEEKMS